MRKLGLLAAALLLCAAPSTQAAELVVDGGFEAGPFSGNWIEFSTNFGTPICDVGSCGMGGGTGPFAGAFWAWFGGIFFYENGILSQPIVLPPGATTLTFQYEKPVVDTAVDYIEARIDGNVVWSDNAGTPIVFPYALQVVDISAFDDGGAHVVEFFSETFAAGGNVSNFFIDNVSILGPDIPSGACCLPGACQITPEPDCDALGGSYLGDGTECFSDSGETADFVENPNVPIPDSPAPGVSDTITVNESFTIADLDVDFVATHTWISDLVVEIEGPDGTTVVLLQNNCGSENDVNVIFDDEAGPLVCGSPLTGGQPENPLSAFDGTDALGTWTITVTDTVGFDVGTLVQWSLHFDKAVSNCVAAGACCTNGPGTASDCVETSQAECEAGDGLFVGGSCADVADCVALFVDIDTMSAKKTARGVLVEWTTAAEIDNQGFRVLRESASREKRMTVVSGFIPAAGNGIEGASYEFLDNQLDQIGAGTRYWIETIDIYGRVERHGPIDVTGTREAPRGRTR
jgi:subtilisin-like proprotein convertase family protein